MAEIRCVGSRIGFDRPAPSPQDPGQSFILAQSIIARTSLLKPTSLIQAYYLLNRNFRGGKSQSLFLYIDSLLNHL